MRIVIISTIAIVIAALIILRGYLHSVKKKERRKNFYFIYNNKSAWHKRV